jgi:hypothetical protein
VGAFGGGREEIVHVAWFDQRDAPSARSKRGGTRRGDANAGLVLAPAPHGVMVPHTRSKRRSAAPRRSCG